MSQTIKIGEETFELNPVKLRFYFYPEPAIDIFADSLRLKMAGIAINCISLTDEIKKVTDLQGKTIELGESVDVDNVSTIALQDSNELLESAICTPQKQLDIARLKLVFGKIADNTIEISLEASCFYDLFEEIEVSAELKANIQDETIKGQK